MLHFDYKRRKINVKRNRKTIRRVRTIVGAKLSAGIDIAETIPYTLVGEVIGLMGGNKIGNEIDRSKK